MRGGRGCYSRPPTEAEEKFDNFTKIILLFLLLLKHMR